MFFFHKINAIMWKSAKNLMFMTNQGQKMILNLLCQKKKYKRSWRMIYLMLFGSLKYKSGHYPDNVTVAKWIEPVPMQSEVKHCLFFFCKQSKTTIASQKVISNTIWVQFWTFHKRLKRRFTHLTKRKHVDFNVI